MAKQPTTETQAQRQLREGKERQAEAVRLQEDRDKATPTPTQNENDQARLGTLEADALQPDGSPEEREAAQTRSVDYATRDAKAK